jgi:cbb3-type cytochrome oxidase maturation protein
MNILLFLIPVTLALGGFGLIAFLWTVKNKQYDDLEGSANRILFDDEIKK